MADFMIFTPPRCSFHFIAENSFATQSINAYFCAPIVSISLNYPVSTLPKPLNVIIIPHHLGTPYTRGLSH